MYQVPNPKSTKYDDLFFSVFQEELGCGIPPASRRARKNWERAYRVAIKHLVLSTFNVKRKIITMNNIFKELSRGSSENSMVSEDNEVLSKQRTPVLLLIGGGMAAGKTTVREIIGSDRFWSKAHRLSVNKVNFLR